MIVVDASAVLEHLLGTEAGDQVRLAVRRDGDRPSPLHAPAHLDPEVAQVLRRMEAAGEAGPRRARAALEALGQFPLHRHSVTSLLPRIWHHRNNLTAYDAGYVALAEALDCPLMTFDSRLARTPGVAVPIIVPGHA